MPAPELYTVRRVLIKWLRKTLFLTSLTKDKAGIASLLAEEKFGVVFNHNLCNLKDKKLKQYIFMHNSLSASQIKANSLDYLYLVMKT